MLIQTLLLCLITNGVPLAPIEETPIVRALLRADALRVHELVEADPGLLAASVKSEKWGPHSISGTPLHIAARRDLHAVAAVLLDLGADVNARDLEGRTPLHRVRSGRMVRTLVAAGADVTVTDTNHRTPLQTFPRFSRAIGRSVASALSGSGVESDLGTAVRLGWEGGVERSLAVHPPERIDPELLYTAAWNGDEAIVALLIEGGVDVNGSLSPSNIINDSPPRSALEHAIQGGSPGVASLLLRAGADGGGRRDIQRVRGWRIIKGGAIVYGRSGDLLDRVVHDGHVEAAGLLLAAGLSLERWPVSRPDGSGPDSRLMRAAWRGHLPLVDLLLDSGASVDALSNGATPLLAAAAAGHEDVYERLLARGATPSLAAAAAAGDIDRVRALSAADPEAMNVRGERCGRAPLAWAVHAGSEDIVELLVASGADVNAEAGLPRHVSMWTWALMPSTAEGRDFEEVSTLALAVRRGQIGIARSLIEAGAAADRSTVKALCNSPDESASRLLTDLLARDHALAAGDAWWAIDGLRALVSVEFRAEIPQTVTLERLETIVTAGGAARLTDEDGKSVFDGATYWRVDDAVGRRLVELGAPVDLASACALGMVDRVREFDRSGEISPDERKGLLHRALMNKRLGVYGVLLENMPAAEPFDDFKAAREAVYRGSDDVFELLLARGAFEIDAVERDGRTFLHHGGRSDSLTRRLLMGGLDPNARNRLDGTPLHSACGGAALESIRILIAAGAAVDARSDRGDTPLITLMYRGGGWDLAESAAVLLEAGADPLAIGYYGPSAWEMVGRARPPEQRAALRAVFEPYLPGFLRD